MDWQLAFTIGAIALAGVFIAWRVGRSLLSMRGTGCSGGCGCPKSTEVPKPEGGLIAPEDLVMRRRVRPD